MRTKPFRVQPRNRGAVGLPPTRIDIEQLDYENANSAEEVIGEMGIVLVGILGIIVAVNLMLTLLHISP